MNAQGLFAVIDRHVDDLSTREIFRAQEPGEAHAVAEMLRRAGDTTVTVTIIPTTDPLTGRA